MGSPYPRRLDRRADCPLGVGRPTHRGPRVAVFAYGRSNAHADLLQSLRAEAVLRSTGWRMGTALNAAASVSGIKHRRDAFH
jgi:hypothetical protein